jgi:hypothetical protein
MGSAMLRRLPETALLLKIGLPVAVLILAAVLGVTRGVALTLLVLAATALLAAILAIWNSIQSLDDDADLSLDEALALGAPSAEEEKKRAVLRALKDLEYERSVGKINEEDYLELSTRYREEARALLRSLAEAELPMRERVEKRLASRLEKAGLGPTAASTPEPAPAPEPEDESEDESEDDDPEKQIADPYDDVARAEAELDSRSGDEDEDEDEDEPAAETKSCGECETVNDLDARFCKKCGAKL